MILVVGDVMTDVIVRPAGPLSRGTDCPASIATRPGGSGANIACWIGHLGGAVRFAGRVGRDDVAEQAAALRKHGVVPCLAADPNLATGRTVTIVDTDGERSFYTDRGANLGLGSEDLPSESLDGCRIVHVSGHALSTAAPRAAVRALTREARARGCAVTADAGSCAYARDAMAEALADRFAEFDLVVANAGEAALLAPAIGPDVTLVITDGARGASAREAGAWFRAAAPELDIVDTIGAGDAFTAGFLVALAAGATLPCRVRAGVAAASRAVLVAGGRPC